MARAQAVQPLAVVTMQALATVEAAMARSKCTSGNYCQLKSVSNSLLTIKTEMSGAAIGKTWLGFLPRRAELHVGSILVTWLHSYIFFSNTLC